MAVIALEIYFGAKLNPKTGRTFCEIFIYNLKSGRIVCACSKVVNHNLSGVKYKLNYQFYRFFNFSNFYFVDKDKNVLLQEEGFCCMAKMGTIVNRNIWFLNYLQNFHESLLCHFEINMVNIKPSWREKFLGKQL